MLPGSVIASSDSKLPEAEFSGYAMIGADIVLGPEGQQAYGTVPAGADGAYTSVERTTTTAVVGTDHAGFARLFLYRSGDRWALGTSLLELAEYARSAGWPLTADHDQVISFLLINPVGNQLTSDRTAFHEIRLVPAGARVEITGGRRRRASVVPPAPLPAWSSYGGLLREGLWEIASRARTLLHSGLPLVATANGGRDFRVVLAALLAGNDTDKSLGELVRLRADDKNAEHWGTVSQLATDYSLELNRRGTVSRAHLEPRAGYALWRRNDLGVYGPIYPYRTDAPEVLLSGSGGEPHRRVYKSPSMAAVLEQARTEDVPSTTLTTLTAAMNSALGAVSRGQDERMVHFREFRERFHGGRTALRQPVFAPLAVGSLRRASALRDPSGELGTQISVDIIRNLAPELLEVPLQPGSKPFPKRQVSAATTVSPKQVVTGRAFGSLSVPKQQAERSSNAIEPFAAAFEEAVERVAGSGLLPSGVLDGARRTVTIAVERGSFEHAADGQVVGAVILAGEVLRLS